VVGKAYEVEELVAEVLRDEVFFRNSGGGVTLSGGEPTLFAEYAGAVAKSIAERGVDVMIETCGDFDWDTFDVHLRPYLGRVWIDLKIFDDRAHRTHCGRSNARTLANIERLAKEGSPDMLVRVPLIPDLTATSENLTAIASFLTGLGLTRVGVMAYNPLWHGKARGLGHSPRMARETWLDNEEKARYRAALGRDLEIVGDL
jgi:pyruvate formate lyase activating enzyme